MCGINSLSSGRCGGDFEYVILHILIIDICIISSEIVLRWIPE